MNLTRSFFGIYHPIHKISLLISDLVSIGIAFYLATYYRLHVVPNVQSIEYIGLNLIIIGSLFLGGAYTSSAIVSAPKLPLKTFFTVIGSALPSMLFVYLLGPERFTSLLGRGVYPFAIIGTGILVVIWRLLINRAFHEQQTSSNILLLGDSNSKERFIQSLNSGQIKLNILHAETIEHQDLSHTRLRAIVISPDHSPNTVEQQLLINYRLSGIPIFSLSDFFESFLFLVPVQEINNDWFIRAEGFTMLHSSVATRIKRSVDIIVATLLISITFPVTLAIALMIKITSKGPVFFSQTRIGIQGKPFTLYKFRTMRVDAEPEGARWASSNDPRILPIGKTLRQSRIDELPQCWNILKGEMSIIGPRPERPEFTSTLAKTIPYYDLRHVIKPGLTGWAQVMYSYGASEEDSLKKLQYDLYYIKNYSMLLDLNILLRTILVTVRRGGR